MPTETVKGKGMSWPRVLLFTAILLMSLLAASIVFRTAVVGFVLPPLLEMQGIQEPRFEVSRLGIDSIELANVRIGAEDEITAERIAIAYDYREGFTAPLERLHIAGLTVKLDPEAARFGLPYSGSGGKESEPRTANIPRLEDLQDLPLPAETLVTGRLVIAQAGQDLSGDFSGRLEKFPGRLPSFALDIHSADLPGTEEKGLDLSVTHDNANVHAGLEVRDAFGIGKLSVSADFELRQLFDFGGAMTSPLERLESAAIDADAALHLEDAATAYGKLNLNLPLEINLAQGQLKLQSARDASLRYVPERSALPERLQEVLPKDLLEDGLAGAPDFSFSLPLSQCLSARTVPCPLAFSMTLALQHLGGSEALLNLMGTTALLLPRDGQEPEYRSEDLALRLSGFPLAPAELDSLTVSGQFEGRGKTLRGRFTGQGALQAVRWNDFSAKRVLAEFSGLLRANPAGIELSQDGGTADGTSARTSDGTSGGTGAAAVFLDLEGLRLPSGLRARGPVRLSISDYRMNLPFERTSESISYRAEGTVQETAFSLPRAGKEPVTLSQKAAGFSVAAPPSDSAGENFIARLSLPEVTARPHDLRLRNFEIALRRAGTADDAANGKPDEFLLDIQSDLLDVQAKEKRFLPLRLQGEGKIGAKDLTIESRLHNEGRSEEVARLTVRHDLEKSTGAANLTSLLPEFSPNGLQPQALSPLFADFNETSGRFKADLQLNWRKSALAGKFLMDVDDLSFRSANLSVEGLTFDFDLHDVFAPRTKPGQRLTIDKLRLPLPVENVSLLFALEPGDPPKLAIQELRFELFGGIVLLNDTRLDYATPQQDLRFEITGLDLPRLASQVAIDGLEAEGTLAGSVPVTISQDGRFRLKDARLAAVAPGKIRFASEQAAQLLAQGGESAQLLIQALENFHYEVLALSLDKSAEHDTQFKLTLKGRNPDLLDGREFNININVDTNVGSLLTAFSEAYSLSNRLLRRAWTLGR